MDEHSHGSMDTTQHEKTFAAFITWVSRSVIAIIALLILLAIVGA